jgi:hypothetical protein
MKILVIPDVHQKLEKVSLILENNSYDMLISLGDWFDDFYDTPEQAEKTAHYIVGLYSRLGERFVWLLGNHDVPYLYPALYDRYACSGNTSAKLKAIQNIFKGHKPLGYSPKLAHVIEIDGCYPLILSHAGVSEHHFGRPRRLKKAEAASVLELCEQALSLSEKNLSHHILKAGHARGGMESVGGINWLDWRHEYVPVKKLSQIVGHTPLSVPSVIDEFRASIAPDEVLPSLDRYKLKPKKSYNINLDTHLEHYITIENNEILIHKLSYLID